MAITVTEKPESRESASGENPAATLVYTVRGTADHTGRFVILLEPIKAGALGRAMLQGVTRVRLYVEEDQTVGFAAPTAGETGYLVPAASGAQVIWRVGGASTDPSDLKWALVRLPHAGAIAGEAQVASVTTSDAWVTRVTAHPLAPDGTADTSVTLTLKATDVGNLAAGYMVGYPSGDGRMEVGDKVGYVAGPGYSETDIDGWLVPYAGADGPVLAVTPNLPAPNILAGAGIWTEVVEGAEGVENVKVHFDPVVPGGGLAWDPAGPGDTSRPFVLTDAARGMARDNDGIFPDLAPKGGLTLSGDPGEVPCRPLLEWLRAVERRGYAWRLGPPESRPVTVARNQIVTRFLEEDTDKQHLVMINAGMVPLPEQPGEASGSGTARILTEPGELVYCACFGRYGLAGHYPHFDTACFRASRAVYVAMPQPWFDFEYDPTRTRLTLCECRWFLRRLPRGVEPKRAGSIGRLTETVVLPTSSGTPRTCCPHELLPQRSDQGVSGPGTIVGRDVY